MKVALPQPETAHIDCFLIAFTPASMSSSPPTEMSSGMIPKTTFFQRHHNRGCMETYAGGFNLMQMAQQATGEELTFDEFIRRAQTGVSPYARLLQDSAEMAGWAIGITSTILSPPDIIIAGKIAAIGPSFLRSVEKSFEKHAVRPPTHAPHVRKPNFIIGKFLPNDETVLGAVALVLHQHWLISERSKA